MKRQTEIQRESLTYVKALCSRITKAIQEIQNKCVQQTLPKSEPQSLGTFEGIGFFAYVKNNEEQLKKKFPALTEQQNLCILLAEWEKLSNVQKLQFCQKFNLGQHPSSKKLKKLEKQGEKFYENLQNSLKPPEIQSQNINSSTDKSNEKTLNRKQSQCQIKQQNRSDQFHAEKQMKTFIKKQQNRSDQFHAEKQMKTFIKKQQKQFQIKEYINEVISSNLNSCKYFNIQNICKKQLQATQDLAIKNKIYDQNNKNVQLFLCLEHNNTKFNQQCQIIKMQINNLNNLSNDQNLQQQNSYRKQQNQKIILPQSLSNFCSQYIQDTLRNIPCQFAQQKQQLIITSQSLKLQVQIIQFLSQCPNFAPHLQSEGLIKNQLEADSKIFEPKSQSC